ncbi:hypothetical protein [Actinoplanes utahensis]|uniref:hypothetical protein n=1 Tax=Actinoplanes utahensis TaxID=1869 RepID=UPI0005BBB114|nr:hypothetical protein [Actinoplanes utahensis]GIF33901.1 hypothetical protein Aut01nite_68870 [Actinoplanes utahensis]
MSSAGRAPRIGGATSSPAPPTGRERLFRLDELLAGVEDDVLAPLTPAQRREQLTGLVDPHGR